MTVINLVGMVCSVSSLQLHFFHAICGSFLILVFFSVKEYFRTSATSLSEIHGRSVSQRDNFAKWLKQRDIAHG